MQALLGVRDAQIALLRGQLRRYGSVEVEPASGSAVPVRTSASPILPSTGLTAVAASEALPSSVECHAKADVADAVALPPPAPTTPPSMTSVCAPASTELPARGMSVVDFPRPVEVLFPTLLPVSHHETQVPDSAVGASEEIFDIPTRSPLDCEELDITRRHGPIVPPGVAVPSGTSTPSAPRPIIARRVPVEVKVESIFAAGGVEQLRAHTPQCQTQTRSGSTLRTSRLVHQGRSGSTPPVVRWNHADVKRDQQSPQIERMLSAPSYNIAPVPVRPSAPTHSSMSPRARVPFSLAPPPRVPELPPGQRCQEAVPAVVETPPRSRSAVHGTHASIGTPRSTPPTASPPSGSPIPQLPVRSMPGQFWSPPLGAPLGKPIGAAGGGGNGHGYGVSQAGGLAKFNMMPHLLVPHVSPLMHSPGIGAVACSRFAPTMLPLSGIPLGGFDNNLHHPCGGGGSFFAPGCQNNPPAVSGRASR